MFIIQHKHFVSILITTTSINDSHKQQVLQQK